MEREWVRAKTAKQDNTPNVWTFSLIADKIIDVGTREKN